MAAGEADQQRNATQDLAVGCLFRAGRLAAAVQLVSVQLQDLGDVIAVCRRNTRFVSSMDWAVLRSAAALQMH